MPSYDFSVVVKHALQRPQIIQAMKRVGDQIYSRGGYIRNIEFVGDRSLPQKSTINEEVHTRGHYFVLKIDLPPLDVQKMSDDIGRDTDIIRRNFIREQPKNDPECTMDDEFKRPTDRPSVQNMIAIGRRPPRFTRIFKPKTGLDYYPFFR